MQNSSQPFATPTLPRRLIAMVYEAFLLAAVEMFAVGVYLVATGNRKGPIYEHGLQAFLFLVTGAYFIHFWTDSGHTLAMKTWRMKVVKPGHARLPLKVAAARYLLAWGWFLPALVACHVLGLRGKAEVSIAIAVGIGAWAMTVFLDQDRQFLHDKLLGTRLIELPKPAKK